MDAVDLFIGGEGTLGVVVGAELELTPRPVVAGHLLVFFRDIDALLRATRMLRHHRLRSTRLLAMEYFDDRSLDLLRAADDLPVVIEGIGWANVPAVL